MFLKLYLQRSEFAGELQAEVTRIGGEPATSGSTAGAIHRGWIGLKTALAADTDHAILEEAERGEDAGRLPDGAQRSAGEPRRERPARLFQCFRASGSTSFGINAV